MTDDPHRSKELRQHRIGNLIALVRVAVVICVGVLIYKGFDELASQSRAQTDALNALTVATKAQVDATRAQADATRAQADTAGARQARDADAKRLALYGRVTEAASKVAALKRAGADAQVQDAVTQYKVLYTGPAAMERNSEAWTAMGLFNRALDASADAASLEKLSLDLAYVCGGRTAGEDVSRNAAAPGVDPGLGVLAEMTRIAQAAEARQAAEQWLVLVDAGQYPESWQAAAGYFQSMIPQERWVRSMAIRQPYGGVLSRKFKGAEYARTLPGAPAGDYVVIQYDTSFANKADAVETVTPMLEKDGKWRVSGYYIK